MFAGPRWMRNFMSRHKDDISVRVAAPVSKKRAGISEAQLLEWFQRLEK